MQKWSAGQDLQESSLLRNSQIFSYRSYGPWFPKTLIFSKTIIDRTKVYVAKMISRPSSTIKSFLRRNRQIFLIWVMALDLQKHSFSQKNVIDRAKVYVAKMISRSRSTIKFVTAKSSNFSSKELWPLISENAYFLENCKRQIKSLCCKNDQQAKFYNKVISATKSSNFSYMSYGPWFPKTFIFSKTIIDRSYGPWFP